MEHTSFEFSTFNFEDTILESYTSKNGNFC